LNLPISAQKHPSLKSLTFFWQSHTGANMSLPKLTKSRLKTLRATHGWQFVANMPKTALRRLAQIDVEIEKLKYTPGWVVGRKMLMRFRIGRGWPQAPKRRIPNNGYRNTKISHWLKDHLRRIADMAADAVCRAANGFSDYQSPDSAVGAFNDHIAPIAELYGFKLQMVVDGECLVLRGDVGKALSVLTYLCSSQRTPEIDWMLDVVTVMTQDQPLQWKGTWDRKLRHTKRGKWWRARRELREQKEAIEAPKERKQQLDRAALVEVFDGDANRSFEGRHVTLPTMAQTEGDVANKRFRGNEQYYPRPRSRVGMAKVRLPNDPYLKSLPDPSSDHWRRGRDLEKKR
jgi:hypothetical protein